MIYIVPDYYKEFRCIANKCEDSCCTGWEIGIDEEAINKYKKVEGGLGNRLANSIDSKRQSFRQYKRRCVFLNEDNLCDLYTELGEDYLCKTCREYPRHIEEYEDCKEVSLSLSCEEVARILLRNTKKVTFITYEREQEEEEQDEFEFFDFLLYTKLMDARKFMIQVLQDRTKDVLSRMAYVLVFAHDLQNRINRNEVYKIDDVCRRYKHTSIKKYVNQKLQTYRGNESKRALIIRQQFQLLFQLERLDELWGEVCKKAYKILFRYGIHKYNKSHKEFLEYIKNHQQLSKQYEIMVEQLVVYFTYGYFAGAVYDERAYTKVKFAIVNTILILQLWQAKWQEKRGLTFRDLTDLTHRYAREVEHSDYNIEKIERALCTREEFKLKNILIIL